MTHSFELRSNGIFLKILTERPNNTFIQLLKKKVGPSKYSKIIKNNDNYYLRINLVVGPTYFCFDMCEPINVLKNPLNLVKFCCAHVIVKHI